MTNTHKGYLIKETIAGETFIEKDGQLIGWAKDLLDARRIIDDLTAHKPGGAHERQAKSPTNQRNPHPRR